MFLAAAALGITLPALNSSDNPAGSPQQPVSAMGFLINDEQRPVGWYSFPLADASEPTKISETDAVSAGAMADGVYYAQTYTPGPLPLAWNTFDIASGTFTKLADCGEGYPLYVDMSYDHSSDEMLAIYHYGANSSALCKINLSDGTPVPYATAENLWLSTLACSYEGEIYSLANDGWLYRFDRNAMTFDRVGDTGVSIEYMQSMEFDHASGTIYWAATNYAGGYFYSIDPATGAASYISDLGQDGEMTGLYIASRIAEDDAPAAVSALTVANPSHDGNIILSLTLPDKTASGATLETIDNIVLEADGEEVKRWEAQGMTPGSNVTLEAETAQGLHVFKIYAVNQAGNGVPRTSRFFVGEDIPASPADVTVQTDGNQAVISWSAVATGAQGGWIDTGALTYEVVRRPGDHVVASGLTGTTCNDAVETTGVYTYSVTPSTPRGAGSPAVSAPAVLGDGVDLPYSYDFEDPDGLLMWSIIDGNADGATWERSKTTDGRRTMIMRGNYTRVVDDWLISPAVRLEAGKAYKIVYDAGCMNPYYPASYSVTIGREATAEGQQTVVKEFTTDLQMLHKTYVYLPEIDQDGTYHIGFHASWQPGLPSLYISNFTIEENQASWLTGIITDGTSPVAGARIAFGPGSDLYTSADDGSFEIIEIEPGEYSLSVSKFGFEPFTGSYTFAALEHKQIEIPLTAIPTASVTGQVVDTDGHGIENASVSVHGYDCYSAVTDKDGFFTVPGVYRKGGYTVDAHALNYESSTRTIGDFDSDTDIGVFTLQEKLIAPANVYVTADRTASTVSWAAPQDIPAQFRYDDGTDNYVFNMEMSNVSQYTAVGVIYDTPAVFTSMSWNVWDTANYAESVDVIVFALDENGQPTDNILYEENGLESENYNWHECVFRYPVVAPNGALFTLRGDARLCMDSGGDDPAYPPMRDKMVMTHDYRTEAFHSRYPDDNSPIFRGNLTLRATGMPYGAPRKSAGENIPEVEYDIWRLVPGQESDPSQWTKLNESPVSETSFADPAWTGAVKGWYRYAVKALYRDGYHSYPAFSQEIPRLLHSDVSLAFQTNAPGEDASSAAVVIVEKDNTNSYSGMADDEGKLTFPQVKEGTYTLTCTKKGFEPFETEIEISGEADFSAVFTLQETTHAPSNLVIEETEDPASRLFRWNVVTGIFDDFEGHDDWAVNSPGEAGWTYIDGDGADTYFSPNYDYPNAGSPMAFAVLNPSQTTPSMTDSRFLDTHSGSKTLVAWCTANGEPNNDFIISPQLEMGEDFVISFWTRCYWSRYTETLRVGYSTGGNSQEDFIWVGDPVYVDYEDWRQIITEIPREARYVAINCISENNYFVAVDDIYIGAADQIPGVTAQNVPAMRAAGSATAYDVYLDGSKVTSTAETTHLFENLTAGTHTAGVVARYASGDTEMSTINFDIQLSGTDLTTGETLAVRACDGTITVTGSSDGERIDLIRPDGTILATAISTGAPVVIHAPQGIYLVKAGNSVFPLSLR